MGWITRAPGNLRILTFHEVNDESDDDLYAISKRQFHDYIALLRDEGYVTLRARDLLGTWPSTLGREKAVLLTFDDGYTSHRETVAEELARHGMKGTFFVLTSLLGAQRVRHSLHGTMRTFLDVEDLRWMDAAGFEIGSHSHSHPMCGRLSREELETELTLSKHRLEQELGHPVTSFSYPYGRRGAYSSETRAALERAGYQTAFTQESVRPTTSSDLLSLPRTGIDRLDSLQTFRRKLDGHYDILGRVWRPSQSKLPSAALGGHLR